jgi:hypothetical protein
MVKLGWFMAFFYHQVNSCTVFKSKDPVVKIWPNPEAGPYNALESHCETRSFIMFPMKKPGKFKLVGGFNLPLWKMMQWKSVGMMTFPTEWKNKKDSKPPPSVCWFINHYNPH